MTKKIEMQSYEEIPEYTGLSGTPLMTIEDEYEWDGHAYGICVGLIKDNGNKESYFKEDKKNNNTDVFDKLRDDIHLIRKYVYFQEYDGMELEGGIKYFVPYKVKNHSSNKPTVTNVYVDNCSNVHYSVEYEILLIADKNLKRYFTVEYETCGTYSSCFFNQIQNIKEIFREWLNEQTHGFRIYENGDMMVTFYDDTGEVYELEFSSIEELLRMITSLRVIKCDEKIIE